MKQTIFSSKAFSKTRKEIEFAYPYIIEQGYEKELKKAGFNLRIAWKFTWNNKITMGDFTSLLLNSLPNIVTIMFIYKLYPAIYHICDRNDMFYAIAGMKRGQFTQVGQAVFLADIIRRGEIEVDI